MKSIFALIFSTLLLQGCMGPPAPMNVEDPVTAEEVCHKGIMYVRFQKGSSHSSWGGAMFDPETKQVMTCSK